MRKRFVFRTVGTRGCKTHRYFKEVGTTDFDYF